MEELESEVKQALDDLQSSIEKQFEELYGKRCETKDTVDFPELLDNPDARCYVCLVYEKLDKFMEELRI